MKKVLFYLFLLIILAAVVLHFGMVRVAPGTVTVVHSNISGILSPPYSKSGLNWTWQRLIPGDAKLYTFPMGKQAVSYPISFLLPPGKWPGINANERFTIKLSALFSFSITPDVAQKLVAAGTTSLHKLSYLLGKMISRDINDILSKGIDQAIKVNTVPNIQNIISPNIKKALTKKVQDAAARFSINKIELTIAFRKLPDMKQYTTLLSILQNNKEIFITQIKQHFSRENSLRSKRSHSVVRLESLKKIAVLITKYPKLLDYLAISKLSDKLRLAILHGAKNNSLQLNHLQQQLKRLTSFLPGNSIEGNDKQKKAPPKPNAQKK